MNEKSTAYRLTEEGIRKCEAFIAECEAKKKRILNVDADTARDVHIPDVREIEKDISGPRIIEGDYRGSWKVTDHYWADHLLHLSMETDFEEKEPGLEEEQTEDTEEER
jgi:hypothetical protein